MSKIYSCFNPPKAKLQKFTMKSLTETAGYVPINQKIADMISAGRRLDDFRKGVYDIPAGTNSDNIPIDPTRKPGYDLSDMAQTMYNIRSRVVKKPVKGAGSSAPASVPAPLIPVVPVPAPAGA